MKVVQQHSSVLSLLAGRGYALWIVFLYSGLEFRLGDLEMLMV